METAKARNELVGKIGEELSSIAYKLIGHGEESEGDGPTEADNEFCANALMAAAFMCDDRPDHFLRRAQLLLEALKAGEKECGEFYAFDAAFEANWSSLDGDKTSKFDLEITSSMTLQSLIQCIGVNLIDAKRRGIGEYTAIIDDCVEIARDVAYTMKVAVDNE